MKPSLTKIWVGALIASAVIIGIYRVALEPFTSSAVSDFHARAESAAQSATDSPASTRRGERPAKAVRPEISKMEPIATGGARSPTNSAVGSVLVTPVSNANPESMPFNLTNQDELIADPWAGTALAFVGYDAGATESWLAAINDPSLPADERKDLIAMARGLTEK